MKKFLILFLGLTILWFSEGAGGSRSKQSQGGADTDTTKILRIGATITLFCKMETDKATSLKWYKDGEEILDNERIFIFDNSTMQITEADMDDIGNYSCRWVDTERQKSFYISVLTLSYKRMPKSATVFQGDRFELKCEVDGEPRPRIEWFKDSINVEEAFNATHFSYKSGDKGIPNATLVITSAEYSDRGEFMCLITSESIVINTTTFVRVKDMYAALWPFIGIVAEVVILCIIIFAYEKNRLKNDLDESDTDQPAEQRNTAAAQQESIRQRK